MNLNILKCIRADYKGKECNLCIDICPDSAISIIKDKITLDLNSCSDCLVCIGECPSEALSSEKFDENSFVLSNIDKTVSCKTNSPCLNVFDRHHFITMAIKLGELNCDLSNCNECEINRDSKVSNKIEQKLNESNRFLEQINQKSISILKKIDINKKRTLFKKLVSKVLVKQKIEKNSNYPVKHQILSNILKPLLDNIKVIDSDFLIDKKIDSSCINCSDCSEFCPTKAITKSESEIFFQTTKCISCSICNDICKFDSITNIKSVDLVDFAFDRAKLLIEHDMLICRECNMPFSYKGDNFCQRCLEFKDDFENIFKLASEIE